VRRRGWLINPMDVTYWWLIPLAVVPAMLGMILIFLDQQITSVIVNRKEHKLKVNVYNRFRRSRLPAGYTLRVHSHRTDAARCVAVPCGVATQRTAYGVNYPSVTQ